jgi:drug/metabolite transporter (DMT)-like permease
VTRRGWLLFLSLSVIWGLPYLFIKVAVEELSPVVVVFGRTALGAVVLLPIAAARGALRPLRPYLPWVTVFALVEMAGPFVLIGWAETRISSSVAALLVAGVPLVTTTIATFTGIELSFTRRRALGLAVGLGGVVALVGLDLRGGQLLAVAAMALAVIGYSTAPLVAAVQLAKAPNLGIAAVSLAITAVVYAPFALVTWPSASVSVDAWASVGVLGLVCSALAFVVFFACIDEIGPTRTAVNTYLNPAVAIILGVIVLSEPLTTGMLLGFPLVIIGSYLATRSGRPRLPEAASLESVARR